ncbi:N-acetylmuramoyl-L-alanine amidase family protein [Coprobacter sp.]
MRYNCRFYLYIFISLFLFPFSVFSQVSGKKFVVVIDAGHGGKDPGAIGKTIREKNINLGIALKLGALIKENNPDVKVVYTRDRDIFVELQQRANIANRAKADLFISIHTNASTNRSAYGTETYTLGLARTEENLRVAKRENSVILLEDDFSKRYEGFDPNSTESYIMFEFLQDKHLEQSINFASSIQKQFRRSALRTDRGVRQAGFLVLRSTGMPSVLVEVGYISNREEEAFLGSQKGQQQMAVSIYNAFCDYKSDCDRKQGAVVSRGKVKESVDTSRSEQQTADRSVVEKENNVSKANNVSTKSTSTSSSQIKEEVVYKIQIMVSPKKYGEKNACFKGLSPISYYKENNLYKYTYGETTDRKKLLQELSRVRKLFKDAFIISFKDGVKLK